MLQESVRIALKPPYQPSLFRFLHAISAGLVALAWFSGLALYCRYDGRLFRLPALWLGNPWDLHKWAGSSLVPVAILLALYAVSLGRWRLRNPANTVMLFALALPLMSGQGMHGRWLVNGQFDHLAYKLHLLGWLMIGAGLLWHLASALQRGGPALLTSVVDLHIKAKDSPLDWPVQIIAWLKHPR